MYKSVQYMYTFLIAVVYLATTMLHIYALHMYKLLINWNVFLEFNNEYECFLLLAKIVLKEI